MLKTNGGGAKSNPIQHYDLRDRATLTAEWPGVEEITAVGLAGVLAAKEEDVEGMAISVLIMPLPQQQQ